MPEQGPRELQHAAAVQLPLPQWGQAGIDLHIFDKQKENEMRKPSKRWLLLLLLLIPILLFTTTGCAEKLPRDDPAYDTVVDEG